jgi:hypothetical protein
MRSKGSQEQVFGYGWALEAGEWLEEALLTKGVVSVEKLLIHSSVVAQATVEPSGVGVEVPSNRGQKMLVDLVSRLETSQVVLERGMKDRRRYESKIHRGSRD